MNNKLAGNVVDLCPVGALLDKDFLFKQRVWLLKPTPSISPVDAGGENIYLEWNEGVVYRIKPRYNHEVNQWWISDDTRYAYKPLTDPKRLKTARKLQHGAPVDTTFGRALEDAEKGLKAVVASNGEARRQIKGGGLRVNDVAVSDDKVILTGANLTPDGVIKLSMGKKRHVLLKIA